MSEPLQKPKSTSPNTPRDYSGLLGGIQELLEAARRTSSRAVNAVMTATYWDDEGELQEGGQL
jgi:hypothetical protein